MALRRQWKENNQMQIYGERHDAELFRSSNDADYRDWKAQVPVRVRRHERLGSNVLIAGGAGTTDRADIMRPKNIALPEVKEAKAERKFARRRVPVDGGGVSLGSDFLGTNNRFKTSYNRQCEAAARDRRNTAAGSFKGNGPSPGTSILSWSQNPHIDPMRRPGQRAEALLRSAQIAKSTPDHIPTPPTSPPQPEQQQQSGFTNDKPRPEAPERYPEPVEESHDCAPPAEGHKPQVPRSGKRRSVQYDRRNFG